jgi:hypothetical protein
MARSPPPASHQLQQHQPHSYQSSPEIHREADKVLEQLAQRVAKQKGITLDEARKELRHWI